jgi:hypothetical protein
MQQDHGAGAGETVADAVAEVRQRLVDKMNERAAGRFEHHPACSLRHFVDVVLQ